MAGASGAGLGVLLHLLFRRWRIRRRYDRGAEATWREVEAMLDELDGRPPTRNRGNRIG